MHTVIFIRLERRERSIVQRVLPSIGAGFPDYPYDKSDHRWKLMAALNGVAKDGSQCSRDLLLHAREALETQIAACAIQADVEHWRSHLLRPAPVGAAVSTSPEPAGAPLVTDPERMCTYLAEQRQVQLCEANAALVVVQAALDLIPPVLEADLDGD